MNSKATIEEVITWAQEHNCILFLDVQPGHSTLQAELPKLEQYLKAPRSFTWASTPSSRWPPCPACAPTRKSAPSTPRT